MTNGKRTRPMSWLLAAALGTLLTVQSAPTSAQGATPAPSSPSADYAVATTKILAIGTFVPNATPDTWRPYIEAEVRQTVELYLGGKIEQWWVKPDQSGVVFLFDAKDPKTVQALLDELPLGRAGLMRFELIPLGPLSPLRQLLKKPGH